MRGLLNSFSNNILLTNLIKIRWIAIGGQISAILLVYYYFKIQIPILLCSLVVILSALVNILSFFTKKIDNYLSDNEAFYFLLFDTIQLAVLLYLTGGIYNPFSLLLIAPIVISAAYLKIVFSIILSLFSILIVIFISNYYISIEWNDNFLVPALFAYGLALSLIISIIFIAIYVYIFAKSSRNISEALSQTRLALANQKKISEFGSLNAAAVHELSTPLNTIFLILDDLLEDKILNKNINIKSEITLLKSQAERCKDILFKISKNPQNLQDNFLNKISLSNIIKINFNKFKNSNIKLHISIKEKQKEPNIKFQDEIMYGVGNIIQNAIQHASKFVNVNLSWTNNIIIIKISDDGPGFSKETLDKIGSPYISSSKKDGMGLGLFITKNLIKNIDGKIFFMNNKDSFGSCVEIQLNRNLLEV